MSIHPGAEDLIACGHVLEDQGQIEAALGFYLRATSSFPNYARAWMNVGNAFERLDRVSDAIHAFKKALEQSPDYAPAHFNLGKLLAEQGDPATAERELLETIRLEPQLVQPSIVLADIYEKRLRFDAAEAHFQRALSLEPNHAGTLLNFGMFQFRQGRIDNAVECFVRAKTIDAGLKDAESYLLFATNFREDVSPETIAIEHRRVGSAIARAAGPPFNDWPNSSMPDRRLRVGYVSGDYSHHPVALFIRPVIRNHDRSHFEVFCYSNNVQIDSAGKELRECADHWREVANVSDVGMIDLIRQDQIDLLVDLSGHTNRNRLAVFARHPAPLQVTWLGYLNTTGLRSMDYRIVDRNTDPEGETEGLHTEQLIRMPYCQWCYMPWYEVERVAQPHEHEANTLVFGSLNQYIKISEQCLDAWCAILTHVPRAKLVVLDVRNTATRGELTQRLVNRGVHSSRVAIHGRQDIAQYFSIVGNVDIALDTFPYNGATTTLDAIWMDTPVVGIRGDRGISRATYSILKTLGTHDLIAENINDYIRTNIRLANDDKWRGSLRKGLRPTLEHSPLMDAKAFTAALEERYRHIWETWCKRHQ